MASKKQPKLYKYRSMQLMWPKRLYVEWWRYAKLADPKVGTFSEWMDAEKYAEPIKDNEIKIVKQKGNKLVLEFDLTHDLRLVGINFKKLIERHVNVPYHKYQSLAKVQPSKKAKDFVLDASKKRRHAYKLQQQGLEKYQIAYKMKYIGKELYMWKKQTRSEKLAFRKKSPKRHSDFQQQWKTAEKQIQRLLKEADKVLNNVKNGTFP